MWTVNVTQNDKDLIQFQFNKMCDATKFAETALEAGMDGAHTTVTVYYEEEK